MNPEKEKARQRKITAAFIAMDPTEIVLIPWTESTTSTGGQKRVDGTPRDPQIFKVIPMTFDQRPEVTSAGKERILDQTLLGTDCAIIEVGDHWYGDDGSRFEVYGFVEGHKYERKALVERHVPKTGG